MIESDPPADERGLILIRTHFVDDRIAEMARRLAADGHYDVLLAIDESGGPIDAGGLPKLSMTLDSCVRLGLNVAFPKPLWRCGDYVFYHALALGRAYKLYWSIEYDVVLNFADPLDFFRFIDARAGEDYLCACLKLADEEWFWWKMTARRFAVVYNALFPLVRLSAFAVTRLLARRRFEAQLLRDADLDPDTHWPNDEGFVSSAAPEMGLKIADFSTYGEFYSQATYAPHLLRHLSELPPPDNKIYHAARAGRSYLSARSSYYKLDLTKVLACNDPDFLDGEYGALLTDLLAERLSAAPDDPSAVFAPTGALVDVYSHLLDARVVEALLRALGRRRLRLCLEAIQFGRLSLSIARTPSFDNVALGRPAWQSSVSRRSRVRDLRRDAEGGNDGDCSAEYGFHTGYQDGPWWAVDLGAVLPVRRVRLFNRKFAEHRLLGFMIETSLDFIAFSTAYAHETTDRKLLHATPIEIALDPPVSARYVRVRLARQGVLHLAEVEVYKA